MYLGQTTTNTGTVTATTTDTTAVAACNPCLELQAQTRQGKWLVIALSTIAVTGIVGFVYSAVAAPKRKTLTAGARRRRFGQPRARALACPC